ncbi:iron complex transport system permease protein [Acetitomaculum ruminis DSM 5522]|uniref:Iron complex transport system permease protein n=1 Tax=Acetitomaculum ruminis DSM 5522 TaxID=1120918 RepID=A0A1I0XC19_9FIRM|nr:iron ABC transporter permease [Acetitomaculum ruminis]SFA97818.1 iron complex transport system permease protein [Acetitomaculum ruminis DSM 5522]
MNNVKNIKVLYTILILLLIGVFIISLIAGRYAISVREIVNILKGSAKKMDETVFFNIRLPRILCAGIIGAGLSVSGASYQGIFRNPCVSPDILGASAGAGFGAVLALFLGVGSVYLSLISFVTGIAAVGFTIFVAGFLNNGMNNSKMILILCGMITTSLFQAFISMVKLVADPYDTLPSITFWLMGGFTYITSDDVLLILSVTMAGMIPLMLLRWRINLMTFSEEEAYSMGVNIKAIKYITIICATLMSAIAVAKGGMIGWIGLVVPHFSRQIMGPDYKKMLPVSALLGAIFTIITDDFARTFFAQELPIGILTALVGAPVFIYLLYQAKEGFS